MNPKIMIVEDSESTNRALKAMLELNDFEVIGEALDGDEALLTFKKTNPDLVLMDIAMPKRHGIDAIKDIKRHDPKAKIIAVTALYSREKRKMALDAGASLVIDKPIDVPELIGAINSTISKDEE
jgi:two-component system chemotaxis response regulator CheY